MKKISAILLAFFICACELIVNVNVPFEGEQLVVNSFVCPDSLWSATISLNRFILAPDTLPYKNVENATVTIHDENGLVATLQHKSEGKYSSETEKPQMGKRYTIHVSAPNYPEVEAESMIPITTPITSVDIEKTGSYNEPVMIIKLKFIDNGQTKDFYHLRVEIVNEYYNYKTGNVTRHDYLQNVSSENPDLNSQVISTDDGLLLKDVLFNGSQAEFRVKMNGNNFSYAAGTRVILRSISEDYYNYLATKELQDESSGDPFAQPVNVYNNISNGFGIFAGLSNSIFEFNNLHPIITGIFPASGKVGDIITITGQNFKSSYNSDNPIISVAFIDTPNYPAWTNTREITDTQLKVVVPIGASLGTKKLLVGRNGSIALSDLEFQVTN